MNVWTKSGITHLIVNLTFAVWLLNSAMAAPITYKATGSSLSGSLGGVPFTNAAYTIRLLADTDNISGAVFTGFLTYYVNTGAAGAGSIEIAGVGTAVFSHILEIFTIDRRPRAESEIVFRLDSGAVGDLPRISGDFDAWNLLGPFSKTGQALVFPSSNTNTSLGLLSITGTAGDVTYSVESAASPEITVFKGTVTDSELTDNTGTQDFGSVTVNASSAPQIFTIRNDGSADLTGIVVTKDVAGQPEDFMLNTSTTATTLAPNGTTTFSVTFSPSAEGNRSAVVRIASNDPDEDPFDIQLVGTSTAPAPSGAFLPLIELGGTGGPGAVLLRGTAAPGMPAGVTFNAFGDISLNENGDAVILGRVVGTGVNAANDAGLWILDGSGLNLMLREGDPAGVPGQTIAEPLRFGRITDTGVTHAMTNLTGAGVTAATNEVGWVDDGSDFTSFYYRGSTFSKLFNGVSQHSATNDGYVTGSLRTVPGTVTALNDTGIWKVAVDGSISDAMREGDVVSGTLVPNSIRVGNLMGRVAVSSTGWGAYAAYITAVRPSVLSAFQTRVVLKQDLANAGAPVIVAQSQVTEVAGVPGARYSVFVSESINAAGRVAFGAHLANNFGGVTTATDYGLWRETGTGLELVLREGQQVPGRALGVVFSSINYHRLLDDGSMVVQASLRGPDVRSGNNVGLWHINTAGELNLLLGAGQPIAALGGSIMNSFVLRLDVSPAGKFITTINLVNRTGDTNGANAFALLLGDARTPGVFDVSIRSGSRYQVGGRVRTVRGGFVGLFSGTNNVNSGGGTGGLSRCVTDSGRAVVTLQFSDGTNGIFILSPTVP